MAPNKKKPFSKYLSKIIPSSSELLFTPQAAELVFILILFLVLSYKNDISTFSETPLGKTCLLILLLYSFFIHPKLGFVLSILAIAYYYSDLVRTLYRATTNTAINHSPYLNENYTSQGFYSNQLINDNQKASPFEGRFIGNLTSPDGSTVLKITSDVCGNLIQFNQRFEGNFIFNSNYGITYDDSNDLSKLTNIDTSYCYIDGDVLGYRQYNDENNYQEYNKIIATIKGNVRYNYTINVNVNEPIKYDKIWLHMNYEDCKSVMTIADNKNANIPYNNKSAFTVREVEGFTFGDTDYKIPSVTFVSSSPPPPPEPVPIPEPENQSQTETPITQEPTPIQEKDSVFIDLTKFRSIGYLSENGSMIVNDQLPIEMSNFELKTFMITIADSKYNIDVSNSILTFVSNTGLSTLENPFNATITIDISGSTEFISNPNSDGLFVSGTIQGNVTSKNINVDTNSGIQTIQMSFLDGEIVNPMVSTSPPPTPSNESFKDMETSVIVDAYPFTKDQVTIPSKFYTQYSYQLPGTSTQTSTPTSAATSAATSNTSFSEYFKQLLTETSTKPNIKTNKESFTDYQTSYQNHKPISPQTKDDILLNNQNQLQNQQNQLQNQHSFRKSYCVNNQLLYKNTPVRSEMAEHIFSNLQINGLAGSNGMKCNPCDPTCPISFSNLDQRLENENIIQKRTRTQQHQSKYNEHNWASKYFDVFLPNPNNHPEFNNQISHSNSSYLIPANARITPMNTPQ
jgi:hypothetical protein